jgi:hypothetical protein
MYLDYSLITELAKFALQVKVKHCSVRSVNGKLLVRLGKRNPHIFYYKRNITGN